MGMFDTIIVKNAKDVLPISDEMRKLSPEVLDKLLDSFQTKDLDSALDTYLIDNGRLYHDERLWQVGTTSAQGTKSDPIPSDWTGVMTFYTYLDDAGTEVAQNAWLEYSAKFYSGELQSVVLKEFRLQETDPATIAAQEKWAAELSASEARIKAKWYNRYIPKPIRVFVAARILQPIGRFCYTASYRLDTF